jgi:exopolyphosphatase/guanosine-5'-triphosphate,3'-diphosphate pyrophosphatase
MLKIAAIDVGSNAIRMTIGEVDASWKVKTIENIRIPIRLGEDVFTQGTLKETTIQRTVDAFQRFQHVAEDFGVYRLRAVATSAMREAGNGQILSERILGACRIKLEIISSDEEARLVHLAVRHVLDLKNKRAMLMDIGGGSVEVTISHGDNITFAKSFDLGAVRLLKLLEKEGDADRTFKQLVSEYSETARRYIEREIGDEKISICAATGGNMEEIGHLRQQLFHVENDRYITLNELEQLIEHLIPMSVEERIREFKLRPDRADVILAAAIVLHLIASQTDVSQIAIPNVGLKDGVLIDIAMGMSRSPHQERREQILESALNLGRKFQFDENHAVVTSKLAGQLFLQSTSLHNLDKNYLFLLEVGALLHDLGHFINTIDHDKHGQYLLNANHLIGMTEREQDIVANLVRFHRGKAPPPDEEGIKSLLPKDRQAVLKLSALLRLADGLDVSHTGRIEKIILKREDNGWQLKLSDEMTLEKWALEKRKALFQEVFGVNLDIG